MIYGLDQDDYTPRHMVDDDGDDAWCFDYIVARTEDASSRCTSEDLDHIVLAVDPQYQGCSDMASSNYKDMIVDYGCTCNKNKCCKTSIGYDEDTGVEGVKFDFKRPITDDEDEMQVYMCVKGVKETQPGLVGYFGVGTYAYSCDDYQVPAFCKGIYD